jgi:dUTP pyrophosphatase
MTDLIYNYFYSELSEKDRKIYAFLLGRLTRENFYINPHGEIFNIDNATFSLTSLVWKFNKYNILNYDRKIIQELIEDIINKKLYIFDLLHGMLYMVRTISSKIYSLGNHVKSIKENLTKGYYKFISGKNVYPLDENSTDYIDFIYNFVKCPIQICSEISFINEIDFLCPYHFELRYLLSLPDAVPPEKNRFSDTGYDLHLCKKIKEENGIVYYNTGIRVRPTRGFYLDIVARSSLVKMGWKIANCVGVIDSNYRGDIIVALEPTGKIQKELVLPFKAVQAIPRRVLQGKLIRVDSLDETDRGDSGGLGSRNFE